MKRFRIRWQLATAALVLLGLGTLSAFQFSGWYRQSRAVAQSQQSLDDARTELTRLQAEQKAAEEAARKEIDAAAAAEQQIAKDFQAAMEAARKAIEAKDFVVRLTGPAHIQPGAPNKWQIETLRHGAVGRPKKMDVVVKDEKDAELFRQTHDKPVGVATLDLPTAFWDEGEARRGPVPRSRRVHGRRSQERAGRAAPARAAGVRHAPGHRQAALQAGRNDPLPLADARPLHAPPAGARPAPEVPPPRPGRCGRAARRGQRPGARGPPAGAGAGQASRSAASASASTRSPPKRRAASTSSTSSRWTRARKSLLETRKFIVNRYVPDVFEKKLEFDGKSLRAGRRACRPGSRCRAPRAGR